jgi:hypothetical protein
VFPLDLDVVITISSTLRSIYARVLRIRGKI